MGRTAQPVIASLVGMLVNAQLQASGSLYASLQAVMRLPYPELSRTQRLGKLSTEEARKGRGGAGR